MDYQNLISNEIRSFEIPSRPWPGNTKTRLGEILSGKAVDKYVGEGQGANSFGVDQQIGAFHHP